MVLLCLALLFPIAFVLPAGLASACGASARGSCLSGLAGVVGVVYVLLHNA